MTPVFADTFFFLALLNANDQVNQDKARAANRVNRPVVTSAWVMMELADHLCDLKNRPLFGQTLQAIKQDSRYQTVSADQQMLDRAIQMYASRPDKEWSLTDCTSFIIMNDRGIVEAMTGDHHFEQAGFVALLK